MDMVDEVYCGFFCIPSSSCVLWLASPAVPVLVFCRVPQVPWGLWVRSGGGAVVVRGTSGVYPRLSCGVMDLGI